MADYWIKLYLEVLDDPKMATLPDRLWRRCIELFLIAGRINGISKDGMIPNVSQIAWMLRQSSDDIELDLKQLETTGIIKRKKDGWVIVNFAKRQSAVPDKERKQYQRGRERHAEYIGVSRESHEDVTKRETDQNRTETDTETEAEEKSKEKEQSRVGVRVPIIAELEY